jgi:hypothetical protein
MNNHEHRTGLRSIASGNGLAALSYETVLYLWEHKYVDIVLTEKGENMYKEIMKSGDGPEALKQMFRM